MKAEIKAARQEMLDRLRAAGIAARKAPGAPKGKRNGKAIQVAKFRTYAEGEKARGGVIVSGDF